MSYLRLMCSERGFGLISAMIAMVLLGIAVTALSSAGVYVLALRTDSEVRSVATAIAASYMEVIKIREPGAIASEAAVRVNEDGAADGSGVYLRSVDVADEASLEDTKRITVTVKYPSGRGRMRTVKLVTILYEGIYN